MYLAILFSDLTASTQITASLEAEDYSYLTSTMRTLFDHIIPGHGGTVIQVSGDGVLASFGYPHATEDDGRRATEAALDLHDAVRELDLGLPLPVPLRMHSGIHEGLVLLEKGDSVTGTLKLVGNAVNVAARLSSVAESDEIVVSAATLGSDRHFFMTDESEVHDLKGVDGPVSAFRVLGRADVGTRFEAREIAGLTPFVARRAELKAIENVFHETLSGVSKFIAIVAPPGLGKTRLVREFLQASVPEDVRVLRGYCESYLGSEPLQPFLQMLLSLFKLDETVDPDEAELLVRDGLRLLDPELAKDAEVFLKALSLGEVEDGGKGDLVASACRLFVALSKASPLILFVDDWQWADDLSRQIFEQLGEEAAPILVIATSRKEPRRLIGTSNVPTIHLTPLDDAALDRAITHLLPGVNRFVAEDIRGFAGGNPLFLEELCRASSEGASQSMMQELTGEAWLGALIVARFEKLPDALADVIRTAAIIGNVVPIALLEGLLGRSLDDDTLRALAADDFLHQDERPGRLRFKHGIAREVVYESVGLHQRRTLHLRIATMLQESVGEGSQDGILESLAYHTLAGDDFEKAASFAERAAQKAVANLALDRGRKQYIAALKAIDRLDATSENYIRRMAVVRRLSPLFVLDPHPAQVQHMQRAVDLALANDDSSGHAYALYWLGYLHYAMGNANDATRHLEEALAAARKLNDERLLGSCDATLGQAYAAATSYEQANSFLDRTVGVITAADARTAKAAGVAYSEAIRGSILGDQGHFEEARSHFSLAREIMEEAPLGFIKASILLWQGAVAGYQGEWEEARLHTQDALTMAEKMKSTLHLGRGTTQLGYIDWKSTGEGACLRTIEEGTSWLEANSVRVFISLDHGWLAEGLLEQNKVPLARRYAAMAFRRARNGDRLGEAMACRAMALAGIDGDMPRSSTHYLTLANRSAHRRDSRREKALNDLCRCRILKGIGEREEAATLRGSAVERFRTMGMVWHAEDAV